jgi:putative DNA primase/helicase
MRYHPVDGSPIPETYEDELELNGHRDSISLVVTEEVLEGEVVDDEESSSKVSDPIIVPPPSNPMGVARAWLEARYGVRDGWAIAHHRNTFYIYEDTSWPELEDRRLESELYDFLEDAIYLKAGIAPVAWEPNRHKLGDVIDAVRALTHIDGARTAPLWIREGRAPAEEIVPVANGLLHLPSRKLLEHEAAFFSQHVLPFEYRSTCPSPSHWLTFLGELWPEDPSSVSTLQELMGYIIAGGTNQQKIGMLVGPRRSGKGTIGRVLTGLLGAHNVAAPTLSSLTTNFGLQPLIGKPLALISDARLGSRADTSTAVERLLSVSGEDSITVDRKYKAAWTGRLSTRFVIMTNEVPKFVDSSGALASRFILLVLTTSFLGKENPALTDELLEEAPGIFNWCLEGWDRLLARGYFVQPDSARDALRRLEDLSSPVSAFARDRCAIGPTHEIEKDDLWDAWKRWSEDEGRSRPGTKALFARDLHAAFPTIRSTRPSRDGKRIHLYEGIGLRSTGDDDPGDDSGEQQWTGPLTTPDRPNPVRGPVTDGAVQNRRSEHSVRDGQGSSALYPPKDQTPHP